MRPGEFWEAVDGARRLAAPHAGKWVAQADEVFEVYADPVPRKVRVARCPSPWIADLVAATHNLFLPMSNALLMAAKKRVDREHMERD